MSKVVHLSEEAHAEAKTFCKARGLKMSDWVASLIIDAVSGKPGAPQVEKAIPTPVPVVRAASSSRKKLLPRLDGPRELIDEDIPELSAPPFWAPLKTPSEDQDDGDNSPE